MPNIQNASFNIFSVSFDMCVKYEKLKGQTYGAFALQKWLEKRRIISLAWLLIAAYWPIIFWDDLVPVWELSWLYSGELFQTNSLEIVPFLAIYASKIHDLKRIAMTVVLLTFFFHSRTAFVMETMNVCCIKSCLVVIRLNIVDIFFEVFVYVLLI